MDSQLVSRIASAVEVIRQSSSLKPSVAVILGTGLGNLASAIEIETAIPYEEIPGFVTSTVEGHAGRLLLGTIRGVPVVAMQGRFHLYEGYDLDQITFPVRVMRALGAGILAVSNACGGVSERLIAGSLMLIEDHINLLGTSPLVGPNHDTLGPRWPDMSEPYDRELMALAEQVALDLRIPLRRGVYACLSGPQLETRAEYRMLRAIGADAVGMSTVPEVIVAVHGGMRVIGFSVVTDECVPERLKKADIGEIISHARAAEALLTPLLSGVIARLKI
ncbi:MAG: purine-nucleoside phosphorylase [Fibrobacteres bacterium]|nr:purine-nucleoside phosphorylase [Fibrobacterota bacterium]